MTVRDDAFDVYEALRMIGAESPASRVAAQIRCPFHAGGKEMNASARVYPATQSVYCFTCGQSWDAVGLLKQAMGIEAGEAIQLLRGRVDTTPLRGDSGAVEVLCEHLLAAVELDLPPDRRRAALESADALLVAAARGSVEAPAVRAWLRQIIASTGSAHQSLIRWKPAISPAARERL